MLLASCNWDWCVLGRATSSGLDEGGLNVEKVLARWICGGINDEYSRAMNILDHYSFTRNLNFGYQLYLFLWIMIHCSLALEHQHDCVLPWSPTLFATE